MEEISIIGVDLAKNVFQLHGAAADGSVVYRKKLSRPQFARFMGKHPACEVDRPDQHAEGKDRRHVERGRDATAVADHAGRRTNHCTCGRDLRTANGAVPPGS